jgi:hypothetical protein
LTVSCSRESKREFKRVQEFKRESELESWRVEELEGKKYEKKNGRITRERENWEGEKRREKELDRLLLCCGSYGVYIHTYLLCAVRLGSCK